MSDESECENLHRYVHRDGELLTRVFEFEDDDDEIMITTHYEDEEFPYGAEIYDREQVEFIHESLGRILNDG